MNEQNQKIKQKTFDYNFNNGIIEIIIRQINKEFFEFYIHLPQELISFKTPQQKISKPGIGHTPLNKPKQILVKSDNVLVGYDTVYGVVGLSEGSLDAVVKARTLVKIEGEIFYKFGFVWDKLKTNLRNELVSLYSKLTPQEKTFFSPKEGNYRAVIMFVIAMIQTIGERNLKNSINENINLLKNENYDEFFNSICSVLYPQQKQEENSKVLKEETKTINSGGENGSIRPNENNENKKSDSTNIRETNRQEIQPITPGLRGHPEPIHKPIRRIPQTDD